MGKFTIKSTSAGFSFNLVADNNEIIATSEVYITKDACKKRQHLYQTQAIQSNIIATAATIWYQSGKARLTIDKNRCYSIAQIINNVTTTKNSMKLTP